MAGWTDITDGKETGSRNRPLVLSLAAPTEFTIPAVIGDYLPLEVKLNILRGRLQFNPARHASRQWIAAAFPKNQGSPA